MDAKLLSSLLPLESGAQVRGLRIEPEEIIADVEVTSATACCPRCGCESDRVHSRYVRRVRDLPCVDRRLQLAVMAHRFFCVNYECPRRVFCERIQALSAPYSRTTTSLTQSHQAIGLALGGEAGARLARTLSVPTSPDTLLRRVRSAKTEPGPPPRYVGVDDWAVRKGQRYGTILIDLERSCVIDVFPGRDGQALKVWLQANPQVEVIARDRWASFAKAATEGAPQAKQVADRWHLLKNLREAIERLFARYLPEILEAMSVIVTSASPVDDGPSTAPIDTANSPTVTAKAVSPREEAITAKKKVRHERHTRVRRLREEGHSIRSIAGETGCSRKAVRRYLADGKCPDWTRSRRPASPLDEHRVTIEAWIVEGGRCWTDLYRLLKLKGLSASYDALRRYVRGRYGDKRRPDPRTKAPKPPSARPKPTLPTARSLSFRFIRLPKESHADAGPTMLGQLREQIPRLNEALDLASEFAGMLRKTNDQPFDDWLTKVEASNVRDLKSFAAGLREDKAAVSNALTEKWSSGPVEGQVNRLKQIKRTMYGRAGLDLLRARVLHKD